MKVNFIPAVKSIACISSVVGISVACVQLKTIENILHYHSSHMTCYCSY